jgi:ribosome-associated protein
LTADRSKNDAERSMLVITPKEMAQAVVKALDGKKGQDICVMETTALTTLADYFVLCTASSTTHLKTLSDETEKALKELGEMPHHIEGYRSGSWVLLDFGCLIVHLFLEEARDFYGLERLWSDAKQVNFSE